MDVINRLSGTKIIGITDSPRAAERVPTVIFEREGSTLTQIAPVGLNRHPPSDQSTGAPSPISKKPFKYSTLD